MGDGYPIWSSQGAWAGKSAQEYAKGEREPARVQSCLATLPGKTSKEIGRRPYRKRTHVDGMSILRRSGDGLFRNSAKWLRNFGRRSAPRKRGRSEMAQATV